jgi:hypothetical protein
MILNRGLLLWKLNMKMVVLLYIFYKNNIFIKNEKEMDQRQNQNIFVKNYSKTHNNYNTPLMSPAGGGPPVLI